MQELIPIGSTSIEGDFVQTVNARDLHAFLQVGKQFSQWIQDRIEKYGFVLDQDFTTFSQGGIKGRPSTEYHLSLDMAKELSMVERSYQGKQARLYFLECERRAKAAAAKPAPLSLDDPHALRSALLSYSEKVIALEAKVIEDAPKVESYEALIACDEGQSMADVAQACGTGRNRLFEFLRDQGVIKKRGKLPYQQYVDAGWFRVHEYVFICPHTGKP